jgi:hypothetical protein
LGAQGVRILFPFFNSPRSVAQDGAYTIHPNPWRPLDCYRDEPFEEGRLDIERLYAWLIPSDAKVTERVVDKPKVPRNPNLARLLRAAACVVVSNTSLEPRQ